MAMNLQQLTESWTQIIHSGEVVVKAKWGEARFHHGTSAPAPDEVAYWPVSLAHRIGESDRSKVFYSGSDNVYVRADKGTAQVIVST